MLQFNLTRLLKLRNIDRPYTWLGRNGFVPQTATRRSKNESGRIRADQLERLCLLLNCTPNDLFDWREDGKTVVHDTHALRTLTKPPPDTNIQTTLRELPLDKLEKLGEMLAELNDKRVDS